MRRCEDYEPLIERMLSDELDGDGLDRLLAHAEGCRGCREFVDLHHRMLDTELENELPTEGEFATVRHAVLRTIRTEQRTTPGWAETASLLRALLLRPVYAGALGAVMLAALAVGVLIGYEGRERSMSGNGEEIARIDPATDIDAVLQQMRQEALGNRQLIDVENSPYLYSNVSFRELDDKAMTVSFDVTRHVEVARSKNDPLVKEALVQSLVNPASVGTRLQAISYAGGLMDPKIKEALIFSMLNDSNLAVRLKALKILGSLDADAEVRAALTAVLGQEESVQMRMLAMDLLVASDPEQAEMERMIDELRAEGDKVLLVRAEDYGSAAGGE